MHILMSHKKKVIFLLSLITILFCTFLLSNSKTDLSTDTEQFHARLLEKIEQADSFEDFTNALFCYEVTADSITTAYKLKNPSSYDIPSLPAVLSSFSYKDYEKSSHKKSDGKIFSLLSSTLKRFQSAELSSPEQLSFELLQNHLTLNQELSGYAYYEDLLGASTGVQANLPVTLGEYPLYTEDSVKTYLTLLKQIPDYFDNVISYQKHRNKIGFTTPDFLMEDTKAKMHTLIESLKEPDNCFAATFEERIASMDGLSAKKKVHYTSQNRLYIEKYILPAYESLYSYVDSLLDTSFKENSSLKKSAKEKQTDTSQNTDSSAICRPDQQTAYGLASLPDGAAYYSLLVKDSTGSDRSMEELIGMVDSSLKQTLGNVLNIALTDPNAYYYYCEHPIETYYQTPESILEALSLMIREDYPVLSTPPSYKIKTVPDSLAASLSPAFYMIPAIDDYQNNTIYINPLYTNEENGNLFTTLAHEGFPGHLYQTVYFNDTNPSPIRNILDYPGYVEGWATYVEMHSFSYLDYPLEGDSLCRLYQADTVINLALCSRIDMGVNYEGWTLADTRKFFEDNGFNSYYAEDVYSYVVEAPANYLSYFIGYLEIEDLKQCYKQQEMENYSEKEFHKKLLDIGPSDFTTLRKFLLVNP